MIRISVITSHLQKDKTYAATVIFDSMNLKEFKLLDSAIKKIVGDLNREGE